MNGFFADISNVEECSISDRTTTCRQIDWQPEEEEKTKSRTDDEGDETNDGDEGGPEDDDSDDEGDTGEDDDDEPIDYDGPDHALEGHTGNGTASDLSEQAPTGGRPARLPQSSSIGTHRGFRCESIHCS